MSGEVYGASGTGIWVKDATFARVYKARYDIFCIFCAVLEGYVTARRIVPFYMSQADAVSQRIESPELFQYQTALFTKSVEKHNGTDTQLFGQQQVGVLVASVDLPFISGNISCHRQSNI